MNMRQPIAGLFLIYINADIMKYEPRLTNAQSALRNKTLRISSPRYKSAEMTQRKATSPVSVTPMSALDTGTAETVQVCVRVRPTTRKKAWNVDGSVITSVISKERYVFDRVLGEDDDNSSLLGIVEPLVDATVQGYNSACCCYGQSGSGKTHTLTGNGNDVGIVQFVISLLFQKLENESERNFMIRMTYLEIYNEKIRDLLSDVENDQIKIMENKNGVPDVHGAVEVTIMNENEGLDYLTKGLERRTVGETVANARSSRSHSILRLTIESNETAGGIKSRTSIMNLVDLAGSEDASANVDASRMKEGVSINVSLLALSKCIAILSDKKKAQGVHVPFRESKLTRILKPSLGGNSKTLVICCVNPAVSTETGRTLNFAKQAKQVEAKPVVNEVTEDGLLSKYLSEIEALKKQLKEKEKVTAEIAEQSVEREKLNKLLKEVIMSKDRSPEASMRAPKVKNRRQTWAPPSKSAELSSCSPLAKLPLFPDIGFRAVIEDIPQFISSRPRNSLPDATPYAGQKLSTGPETKFGNLSDQGAETDMDTENHLLLDVEFSLRRDVSELKDQLQKAKVEASQLQESNDSLRSENNSLSLKIGSLERQNERLTKDVEYLQDRQNAFDSLSTELDRMAQMKCLLEKENTELRTANIELENRLSMDSMAVGERPRLLSHNEQLVLQVSGLKDKLNVITAKCEDLSDEKEQLEIKIERLHQELSALKMSTQQEKRSIEEKFVNFKNLSENQKSLMEVKCSSLQEEIIQLQNIRKSSETEIVRSLEARNSLLTSLLESSKEEIERLKAELGSLRESVVTEIQAKVQAKMEADSALIDQLRLDLGRKQTQLNNLLVNLSTMEHQMATLDTSAGDAIPSTVNAADESVLHEKTFSAEIARLTNDLDAAQLKCNELLSYEKEANILREKVKQLKHQNEQLSAKAHCADKQREDCIRIYQDRMISSRSAEAELKSELAEKNHYIDNVLAKYDELKSNFSSKEQDVQKLTAQVVQLRADRDNVQKLLNVERAKLIQQTLGNKEGKIRLKELEIDLQIARKERSEALEKLTEALRDRVSNGSTSEQTKIKELKESLSSVEEKLAESTKMLEEKSTQLRTALTLKEKAMTELLRLRSAEISLPISSKCELECLPKIAKLNSELEKAHADIEELNEKKRKGYRYIELLKRENAELKDRQKQLLSPLKERSGNVMSN